LLIIHLRYIVMGQILNSFGWYVMSDIFLLCFCIINHVRLLYRSMIY
jgi:hypothetical protein